MAENVAIGSKEWFHGLFNGLAQAGVGILANALKPRAAVVDAQAKTTQNTPAQSVLKYLPYALVGVFALILVLVFKHK